jgi:drug/metabolite transporter (DMT)-like permease
MTLFAFILIISSAALHASWNLVAKKNRVDLPFVGGLCLVSGIFLSPILFWTPVRIFQLPGAFWLSLLCTMLGDCMYWIGLMRAYKSLDMSCAYPMMRSLPLLLTAAVTALLGIGKPLTPAATAGMLLIFSGCLSMPLKSFKDWNVKSYLQKGMFFVLLTACGTTWYTVFDSQTQKIMLESTTLEGISKPVISVTYSAIREMVLTVIILTPVLLQREKRLDWLNLLKAKESRLALIFAGIAASLTYLLVLMAMNYVSNVTYVQIFRQSGLLFGVALGILFLKEKPLPPRITGAVLIVTGLILCSVR